MLSKRVLVVVILLPIGLVMVALGGIYFTTFITLALTLAAWEYIKMMRQCGYQPATWLVLAGIIALSVSRVFNQFYTSAWIISALILAALAVHLFAYERGRDLAAVDFGVTLGGMLYLGWIGAYLISLRNLENGAYWLMLALLSVWFADSAAYFIGTKWGKRRLSPRLSPRKSWEGYWAGVVFGTLGGILVGWGFSQWIGEESGISAVSGMAIGLSLSLVTTLGDLGESMFKRLAGVKDSSGILPGHGGVFDRIDSWLWAGVIAYYLIIFLFT
jgi:phosphatidate cytidylyltransferase